MNKTNSVIFFYKDEEDRQIKKIFLDTEKMTSLLEYAIEAIKWVYLMNLGGRLELKQKGRIVYQMFIEKNGS